MRVLARVTGATDQPWNDPTELQVVFDMERIVRLPCVDDDSFVTNALAFALGDAISYGGRLHKSRVETDQACRRLLAFQGPGHYYAIHPGAISAVPAPVGYEPGPDERVATIDIERLLFRFGALELTVEHWKNGRPEWDFVTIARQRHQQSLQDVDIELDRLMTTVVASLLLRDGTLTNSRMRALAVPLALATEHPFARSRPGHVMDEGASALRRAVHLGLATPPAWTFTHNWERFTAGPLLQRFAEHYAPGIELVQHFDEFTTETLVAASALHVVQLSDALGGATDSGSAWRLAVAELSGHERSTAQRVLSTAGRLAAQPL